MASELAVRSAIADAIPEDEEPDQLGLFGEPQTEAGQRLAVLRGRGPGRPKGSRNKRTERSVRFLLARHRDPREVLLEIAEANVFDLAAELGCTLLEALQEKRLAAIGVLPYVAARITPEVLNDNRQVVHLTINEGVAEAPIADGNDVVQTVLQDVEYREIDVTAEDASAISDDMSDG